MWNPKNSKASALFGEAFLWLSFRKNGRTMLSFAYSEVEEKSKMHHMFSKPNSCPHGYGLGGVVSFTKHKTHLGFIPKIKNRRNERVQAYVCKC